MKKHYGFLLFLLSLVSYNFAQNCTSQAVAVPNFTNNQIVLYNPNGTVYKTIDVHVALLLPPVGTTLGVNSVVFINSDLFVGVANNGGSDFGGILHYTLNQVQNNLDPTVLATPNNQPVIAVAKDPADNLLVATAATGGSSGVICRYTAVDNYDISSLKSLPITAEMNNWVQAFGGIAAYDANTIFTTDVIGNAMISYHNIDWSMNPVTVEVTILKDVPSNSPFLFSLPEGIALDDNHDLWISSNNDTYSTHLNTTGNLVHLTQTMWQNHIAAGNPIVITIDSNLPGVSNFEIMENGTNPTMLGGIVANGNCLYVNNQKAGDITQVLQYKISNNTVSGTTFEQTYPGFGGIDIFTNTPFYTTGIAHPQSLNELGIKVFPNPTVDNLNIEWETNQHFEVNVFDMMGREVLEPISVIGKDVSLDMSTLPVGVYQVVFVGESVVSTRVIKQ